jgi:hypothetical protein
MRARRSPEEIKAWYKTMADRAAEIRAMSETDRENLAAQAGTITCEGCPLSVFNTCFLWQQAGRALLQVGGFRQWKKAGREVIKGQHASGYIYVPMQKREEDADGSDEGGETEEKARKFFKLVPVFDVTQTVEIGAAEMAVTL